MTSPLPNSEDAQLDEILDDLAWELVNWDNPTDFPKVPQEHAKQTLKQLIEQRELDARINQVRNMESLGDAVWQERYFDEVIAKLQDQKGKTYDN